jgi:cytoskeletal protein CcmA (bactofilin family)
MIRMGRSSKTEQENETDSYGQQTNYQHTSGNSPSETRAISESESMARDIKEGRLSGFVGSGTTLTGDTNFQAMLRVDGHLTGKVSSETGTLIIGMGGQVDANIVVSEALISGMVNGDIIATEKLQLGRTARVVGNIQTPRLTIDDGAILEGSCTMLKAKESMEKRKLEATKGTSGSLSDSEDDDDISEEETATNSYYSTSSYSETASDEDDEDELEETAEAATT